LMHCRLSMNRMKFTKGHTGTMMLSLYVFSEL
jgi:hypothetical protein